MVAPRVSVIVVNYHGAADTITCLRGLRDELDYPADALQLICVDNSTEQAEADRIAAGVPEALLIRAERNLGFAAGCNRGAEHADGDVLAFLNNDARPHRDWARAAVEVMAREPTVAAVASKVLDWDGERVDFVGGGLSWFGMGYKPHAGTVDDGSHDAARDVLYGTGAAMLVRRSVFTALGGFDERLFMFFEDVDLGWRLNLRGWRVRYEPRSLAYHRHHRSFSGVDPAREAYLLERNALATLYKNASAETLATVLPGAIALTIKRAIARGEVDSGGLELTAPDAPDPLPGITTAGVFAVDQFVSLLPQLRASREAEQAHRVRTDADLLPLMGNPLERASPEIDYLLAHDELVAALGITDHYGRRRRRIAILTADAISERMAGPAIRAWNMADVLAAEHDVRLVSLNPYGTAPDTTVDFDIHHTGAKVMGPHLDWADVVVLQGHVMERLPALRTSNHIVVCDIYDPMHLEQLEQGRDLSAEQRENVVTSTTAVLSRQLERGDFFLCASERQRHFWLGHLAAIGRLNPTLYDADPTSRSLLDVAPFGLPAKPPQRSGPGLRDQVPGVGQHDTVVLWAGGVYSWFDPLTLLRAVHQLVADHPDLRLVFLGMRHPNPDVPEMGMAAETRRLADMLGVTGKHVFFNEAWVPYSERQNWLLDADCGVTTHHEHVETTFAFRTRVLDYLWAGLPIITTDGDAFAELVYREHLGAVVPSEDPDALAGALSRVLYDRAFVAGCRERIAEVAQRFTWETSLAPLVEFCRDPRPAADRLAGTSPLTSTRRGGALRRDLELVRGYLADGGPREVLRRAAGRLRRISR